MCLDYWLVIGFSTWSMSMIHVRILVAWRIISRGSGLSIRGWAISLGAFQLRLMMELSGNQFDHHYWWKTKKSCIRSKVCLMILYCLCLLIYTGLAATTWKKRHVTADVGPHLTLFATTKTHLPSECRWKSPGFNPECKNKVARYIMLAIIPTWAKEVLRTEQITPKPWRLTSLASSSPSPSAGFKVPLPASGRRVSPGF